MPSALPTVATLLDLIKFRLLLLVLVSTSMGYFLGLRAESSLTTLVLTLVGVLLVGGGANTLNQWKERHADALMHRTRNRPLVAGRITPAATLAFGGLITVAGLLVLALGVNTLTLALSFLSWFSYLFLYTPLKTITPANTWIGAVPGALPAVLGCTAASNSLDATALAVFLLLYFWQLPHFLAISWVYREDYLRGGFRMLSWNDEQGIRTARHILLHALLLLPVSTGLFVIGVSGLLYLIVALIAGVIMLQLALSFRRQLDRAQAMRVFHYSILYLPLLFGGLLLDRGLALF